MINRNASRIAAVLVTLGLIASMSAWAGSRGHHGHHRYHGYGHYGLYGYGGYGHYGYYGHHSPYGHGYYGNYSPRFYGPDGNLYRGVGTVGDLGGLDLNVKPKNTQVYLNGNYIGVTGRFDGFPDYLWLKEGTYELVFYNEGHLTVVQEFAIHSGAVIDVNLRLVPGQSVLPEELTSKDAARHELGQSDKAQ